MANEFIARKGLIVLNNGAKVTGSLGVQGDINASGYNVTASNLQLLGSASIDGDITLGGNLTVGNADIDVVKFLAKVSSSIIPDVHNAFDLGSGSKYWRNLYVSGTAYVGTVQATNINLNTITVVNDLNVNGNTNLGNGLGDVVTITGSLLGTGSTNLTGPVTVTGNVTATSFSGSLSGSGLNITNIPNSGLQNSSVTINAGSGLTQGGSVALGSSVTVALDTGSSTFTDGVKTKLNTEGVFSSSVQVDVRQTTGINTIATTGSNTFTGVQTINNTTNATSHLDGALIVAGGVGIGKDVYVSGSMTVTGLLTAVSMSTQYVTSSQYNIGVSKIVLNDDDVVRFAGISVVDSGSSQATGSLYWDSLRNHWMYENSSGSAYNSAIIIAGPKTTGSLGTEPELVVGRIPVASGGDHIDNRVGYSPLRIEGSVLHAEDNIYVTGSVTASAFSGDGSGLTGIVTNLNITGSGGGTGTVSLKTQGLIVSGTNGVAVSVSGQTLTISGSNATTSSIGVASYNGTNFSVVGGQVSSNAINFNGANINLGGTHAFGLQNITPYGASTTDQVTLTGGAIISTVLYNSATNTDVDTGTEVVATLATGSYDAAFFDYVIKKGSSRRTGTVMAVWEAGTTNVEYTDTSTNDLGNTGDVVFVVDTLAGDARLKATVSSDNWSIKTAIRAI